MSPVAARRPIRQFMLGAGIVTLAAVSGLSLYFGPPGLGAPATGQAAPARAVPVTVAVVREQSAMLWDDFSGRLEAVERVDVRSRVAGAVKALHFAEGEFVRAGDLLVTIDADPYEAEVQRLEAQFAAAQARLALGASDLERGQRLWESRAVTSRDLDTRVNAQREAQANVAAAAAAVRTARLSLGYTEVRAPVAGRVGRRDVTAGNLVSAGPGAPILTTLVSVDPIYASFNADEGVVTRALAALTGEGGARDRIDRIPVEMVTNDGTRTIRGRLQLIDNHVDGDSGTVRVRAVFDNQDGALMAGQFARLRMGQVKTEPALMVAERAVGTDQDKKFVMVVGPDDKAAYRAVTLGATIDGLRVVRSGLVAGERVVVNGLQRIRPGSLVKPQEVAMGGPAGQPVVVASSNRTAAER